MSKLIKKVQYIGLDVGRGYLKAFSVYDGIEYSCKFKSVAGLGRNIELSEYENPIHVEVANEEWFIGEVAEHEGDTLIYNTRDDKTTKTVETLIYGALNEIAMSEHVKIMLGVPNKSFKKSVLTAVIEKYKGKTIEIKNKITGAYKKVTILDISIFREGDAALLWHANNYPTLANGDLALVTVGFRTTELSYYNKGLKFNDKLSKTIEKGNKTALEFVQRQLAKKEESVIHELGVIDSSSEYQALKNTAYEVLSESIANDIEQTWINLPEIAIFTAGGTALHLKLEYELIEDPQMATAKGLWLVATKKFTA